MKVLRSAHQVFLPLLAALSSTALAAGLLLAAPAPSAQNHLGAALALRASLHALVPADTHSQSFQNSGVPSNVRHAGDGRYIYHKPNQRMHAGALLRSHATTAVTPQVDEAVQTFDVFNPPPAFTLAAGQSLTPMNLTPVWSADETMLIFSSNRTSTGTAGTRYHIWAIPINGGTAIQLTNSTPPVGETAGLAHGEFFPALSAGNNQNLAFTSDANTANVRNLYVIPFTATATTINGLASPTNQGVDTSGNSVTGIGGVFRPSFSPTNSDEIVFSGLSTSGKYAGRQHIYFLYQSTRGFNPATASLPGKLTDGPADDTDPAFSQDGQYIAFASTASALAATGLAPSSDPNVAPIATAVTAGTTVTSNRSIFLMTGAAGLSNGGQPVTAASTGDNFGPAWSSNRTNPYLNPAPGYEYIAFSRGTAQLSPHDIFYLQVLQNVQAGGESSRSNEASSTPLNPAAAPPEPGFPVFQVNAGDTTASDNFGGYVADTFLNPNNNNTPSFFVNGGTADPPATPPAVFNTTGDPGTPPQIYQTDRSGTFTYTFPNLTPVATYLVRLHLADTKETAAGKRVFNVSVNGVVTAPDGQPANKPNIDIVGTALQSPGRIDGLVSDTATGNPIAATITVAAATPVVLASSTTLSPDPSGTPNQINYNGAVTQGSYTVTATAQGYNSVSQTVTISSGAYTRVDFNLAQGSGSFTGAVTDSNNNGISGVVLTVTDAATGATVTTTGDAVTDGSGNYGTTAGGGPVTLAPGSYYVTATPPAGSGYTTQSQALTVTNGSVSTVSFSLQNITSANVGTLGGLVTNATSAAPITGATIVVKGNGNVVAILKTGAQSTPAAPNGDGKPVNYLANLPIGNYTLQISAFGYAPATKQVIVANSPAPASAFVRGDQALTSTAPTVGQYTAIVEDYTVQVPLNDAFDKNGLIIAPRGAITLAFNPVSGDPPIVQGIEVLSDPSPTFSSGFGSFGTPNFSGTASSAPQVEVLGGAQTTTGTAATPVMTVLLTNSGTQPSAYHIYRTPAPGAATLVNQPPPSGAGSESSVIYATVPATPGNTTTVFPDTGVVFGNQYYYQATAVYTEALAPESVSNPVVKLNTSDPANQYDDIYPTWSPFLSVFSIAYSSDRSVTYTDPVSGQASETAISVGANGSLGNGSTVGAFYAGLLESQVLNLDPPTLVPYNGNEILHINTGPAYSATTTTRTGVTPGQQATVTVRLSSREAGVDDAHVYLQIKDPDSKYQDAQGLEHKVFARDSLFRNQQNNPNSGHLDSGSSAYLMNGGSNYTLSQVVSNPSLLLTYSGFNQFTINGQLLALSQRGAVGGTEDAGAQTGAGSGAGSNAADTISVGNDFAGSVNLAPVVDGNGKPVVDANKNLVQLPGGDPNLFTPTGPEYECQVVNPTFINADTVPTDYASPYWLAGIDDQNPFSGNSGKYRPATEWLPMTRLSPSQQDGQGGILYSVTWKTPTSQSDYYLDVVAFDKAVPPPTSFVVQPGSNWRIYDNVWGFSTQASIGNQDILLVSDYALGQKFGATTFGGQRGLLNLVPKLYGAESYVSDIDDSLLPNAIFRYAVFPGADPKNPQSEVLDLGVAYNPADTPTGSGNFERFPVRNGLGVNSYFDAFIEDGGRVDSAPAVHSQLYSIWRTLARGPIPSAIYAAYEPTLQPQPAVSDAGGATPVAVAAGTVPLATRCIVWISPFTGDVLAGSGTLADTNTQNDLRAFVKAGGRLCISGQDVGSALTQNGTVNNGPGGFLSDVLNATLVSPNQGTHIPQGGTDPANNRISNIPSFDGHLQGAYQETVAGTFDYVEVSTATRPIRVSNNYGGNIFSSNLVFTPNFAGNWITDGSLDQLGPYIQGFPSQSSNTNSVVGQIDTIKPNAGPNVHTDLTLGQFANPIPIPPVSNLGDPNAASAPGGVGLIYSESPISASGGTGSKVVYATIGLEALGTGYYKQIATFKPGPTAYFPRNQRQNILHNIVSYLRTASISGTIRSTTGNNTVGAGIPGATVYVQSAYGVAIPGRGTFSALTDGAGNYNIGGLEPGNYTLVAYKTGYNRAVSNPGTVLTVEGDVALTGANLSLVQGASGIITGVVTDTNSKIVPGATVTFTTSDGQNQSTTTDANGVYTLSNVPPGTYTGTATSTGSSATSPQETVTSGATLTVNFKLAAGSGTATGRVIDNNGNPIPAATVFFNGGGLATAVQAVTNGSGVYTTPSLPAGNYIVTATAAGFGASTPITVVIASTVVTSVPDITLGPVANGTLGGLVTAAGSTTPAAGVTINIISTATGLAVTPAPVSVSTATAAPDGSGTINYGPVTLQQGTYTVSATQGGVTSAAQTVTIPANGFARVDFTGTTGLQPLHTFASGLQFVSTPFDYSAAGFNGLFGTLNTALAGTTPNGNRSNVAVWNALTGAYVLDPNAPADTLRPGVGYWVYLRGQTAVTQTGTVLTGSVQVSLNPGWNQIGVPNPTGVSVGNLTFTGTNGQTYPFLDAAGSTYHLVQATLYSYNGTGYTAVGTGTTLQPWQGYWIRVFTPVTVNIPTGK